MTFTRCHVLSKVSLWERILDTKTVLIKHTEDGTRRKDKLLASRLIQIGSKAEIFGTGD